MRAGSTATRTLRITQSNDHRATAGDSFDSFCRERFPSEELTRQFRPLSAGYSHRLGWGFALRQAIPQTT